MSTQWLRDEVDPCRCAGVLSSRQNHQPSVVGAITGAHWVQTPDYVQVTGFGDLTELNITEGDDQGERNPDVGLVCSVSSCFILIALIGS